MAKPQIFDRTPEKVLESVTVYKLYLRMKIRKVIVKEQIQWVLLYIQGESADMWKENTLEDLEQRLLKYESVGEFSADIRKKFRGDNKETIKIVELKRLK